MKEKLSTLRNLNKYNHPDHPPRYSPLVRIVRMLDSVSSTLIQHVDRLNDWPRSGDSDIPPVTHARDLRSAPVAPLIP